MLRCPSTQITLSVADIHQTLQMLEARQQYHQSLAPGHVRPRVLRGPERFMDEAMTCP